MNRLRIAPLLLGSLLAAGAASAQQQKATPRGGDFDEATVQALAELPVQHGGRVQPLGTLAAYTLFSVHGRRDMKLDTDGDGSTDTVLSPTEWLLDVWCFPDRAADYPLFRIENVQSLDALDIEHQGQRLNFDFVSYRRLLTPAGGDGKRPVDALIELSRKLHDVKDQDRDPVQQELMQTLQRVSAYHTLHQQLEVLRWPHAVEGEAFQALFRDSEGAPRKEVAFADLLVRGNAIADLLRQVQDGEADPKLGNVMSTAAVLANVVQEANDGPALFPPRGTRQENEEWLSLGRLTDAALRSQLDTRQAAMITHLQNAISAGDDATRGRELRAFRDVVVERAEQRGEYDKVALEAYYYDASWHYRALHWFLFAIVLVAVGWMVPRSKLLWWAGLGVSALAWSFLVADIALRSFVRSRPPITNLYDTFLFIGAVGVLAALVTELINKRRIALAAAPIFGALMIQFARSFEVMDGKDTMAPLIAVLDTNYYLATHVTTINMGYAAGMLAALLGTKALVLRAVGFRRDDVAFHKSLVRMTYGVTCFGLIFAVFGTIYGGVWANDSWGRFWGWDPKENGALLICLAQVALLHARMCGWVRDLGFCTWAALTGCVVAFSWFHVNLLGIGLHSYGFAGGLKTAVVSYYVVQCGLVVLAWAGILWQHVRELERAQLAAEKRAAADAAR